MTAREMFEALGYECRKSENAIQYLSECGKEITFMFELHRFYKQRNFISLNIDIDEFKAIHQQMKELGWLEEEKQEIKQETNYDHYKDKIIEYFQDGLAVVKGIPKTCYKTNCNDCDFKINQEGCHQKVKDWLKQTYEKPVYKLTKFEIDLLQSCSQGYSPEYQFKNINSLTEMRKNGYFKCVNMDETIEDILAKSEVVG